MGLSPPSCSKRTTANSYGSSHHRESMSTFDLLTFLWSFRFNNARNQVLEEKEKEPFRERNVYSLKVLHFKSCLSKSTEG